MKNKYGIKRYTEDNLNTSDKDLRQCPCCEGIYERSDMQFTRDCHGITYRLVCLNCYDVCMEDGYDGAYYTETDECIDYDY